MSLKTALETDKTAAMREAGTATGEAKAAADIRLSTLRALLTAVTSAETAGKTRADLDDTAVLAVLRKQYKQRLDAAKMYTDAGADDRAAKENAEAEVINAYLPQMLDEDATRALVRETITQTGATNIGALMKALGGRGDIDRGLVSRVARDLL